MATPDSTVFEVIKWVWTAVTAPVLDWIAGRFGARQQMKRRRRAIIRDLEGLPIECKAILLEFHNQHTHTLRTDPGSPPMRVLMQRGIARRGPGGGTYDAVDSYVSIAPAVWEVMDDWVAADQQISTAADDATQ